MTRAFLRLSEIRERWEEFSPSSFPAPGMASEHRWIWWGVDNVEDRGSRGDPFRAEHVFVLDREGREWKFQWWSASGMMQQDEDFDPSDVEYEVDEVRMRAKAGLAPWEVASWAIEALLEVEWERNFEVDWFSSDVRTQDDLDAVVGGDPRPKDVIDPFSGEMVWLGPVSATWASIAKAFKIRVVPVRRGP